MPGLTDDELRAIAYYAIGVGSEGRDVAYQLSFAGNHIHEKDGTVRLEPIGNSGYSVGEMQIDLGQHPDDAKALIAAYKNWAKIHHPDWLPSEQQQAQYASDLGRDGHHIRDAHYDADDAAYRAQHHAHIPGRLLPKAGTDIDPLFKSRIDTYLATDDGKPFVHGLDVKQVNDLVESVAKPLDSVPFYQGASPDEQAKIFAVTAKAYNQNEKFGRELLAEMQHRQINSLAAISARVDTFPDGSSHYMQTGRDAALQGAALFDALRNARNDSPLHGIWQTVSADPLANPAQVGHASGHPHSANQYATVKGLFVRPVHGRNFVTALDGGASYNRGDPATVHSRGLYVEGRDFLQWDRDGRGRAFINGQWSTFSRDEVSLTHNHDHTLDVQLTRDGATETLLHVVHPVSTHSRLHQATTGVLRAGALGEAVGALQSDLHELGYLDANGVDGRFGPQTRSAVERFQHDHGLGVDGIVGAATRQQLNAGLQARLEVAHVPARESGNVTTSGDFSDPHHPRHAMYAYLRAVFPPTASRERLHQATAVCHLAGIYGPQNLEGIYGGKSAIVFIPNSPLGRTSAMDVAAPAPSVQQSMRQVQAFDQQQAPQSMQNLQKPQLQQGAGFGGFR